MIFSDVIWMLNFYLREDSLGNVYTLHSNYIDTSYIEQPEYLLFPYDSKEGDDWVIARHKILCLGRFIWTLHFN